MTAPSRTPLPGAPLPVLERALQAMTSPGTNRRGHGPGAAWTLLLDRLDLAHATCLGLPGERTLRMLAARAQRVTVVCSGAAAQRRAARRIARGGAAPNVAAITVAGVDAVGPVDVTVVTGPAWARRIDADAALAALLRRSDAVYAEVGLPDLALAGRPVQRLWLVASGGEVERIAGADDEPATALLKPPARRRGARALAARARHPRRPRALVRQGVLAAPDGRAPGGIGVPAPAYLREIADQAGAPVDDCRVALAAPADYPSRKAVLFLLPGDAPAPRYVVKLTRAPAFNDRLENEWRALRALETAGVGDPATVPRAVFLGHPGGIALLGQTAIAGAPFRACTTATPDCPLARAATEWLLTLGAATADGDVADGTQVAEALQILLDRFAALYRPSAADHALLRAQVEAVADSRSPFPLVLQHGDPGTWNLLVADDGRPAFLDWEAAELHGMPLWDLFYFARSVAVGVGRAAGTRSALDAFSEQLLEDGPLSRALAADVERHCAAIGLDRALVGPLFFCCWMHRALKEATRLRPGGLRRGRYAALLRLCLERRYAPGLVRLTGPPTA